MLSLPQGFENAIVENLQEGQKILLFGIGSGFDLVAGLPLYYTLRRMEAPVELATFSLTDVSLLDTNSSPKKLNDHVHIANPEISTMLEHYPEGYLSAWFKEGFQEDVDIWMFGKQTVSDLKRNFSILLEHLSIGLVIFTSSGIRPIMTGQEEGCGDILHSSIVSEASKVLSQKKLLFTNGINTNGRRPESLMNAYLNISELIKLDAYYGCSFLDKHLDCFEYMQSAYDFISSQHGHQLDGGIEMALTAAYGLNGKHKLGGYICPLMAQTHFFDFDQVAQRNIIGPKIELEETYANIVNQGLAIIDGLRNFPSEPIPA